MTKREKSFSLLVLSVMFCTSAARAQGTPNLTIDGSQASQTMDGMGTNVNVNSWNGGQLQPTLDLLISTYGSSTMRVIRDPMDWVSDESLIPPLHNLEPTTLQQVYEAPKMQDIWNTIGYLNQKGLKGSAITLNFMGWTPTWLGGSGAYGVASYITSGKEGEWATMVASLVYYGRKVKNLDFSLLAPLNEEDWNCLEGPCVAPTQYVICLQDLVAELSYMGLSDIRIVAPDTASSPDSYLTPMMSNSAVAGQIDHLSLHHYGGSISPGAAFPPRNYWLTETAATCLTCGTGGSPSQGEWAYASQTADYVLQDLSNGLPNVLVYDGYDAFYYHHNTYTTRGLFAYNQTTGVYTPRPRFYTTAQIVRFIRPGFVRIGENDSISVLGTTVAFFDAATSQLTITGHNTGSSAITINGQLLNLPTTIGSLGLYETNTSLNLQRATDVAVTGGAFSVQVPADTFFTLTNIPTQIPTPPTNLTAVIQ